MGIDPKLAIERLPDPCRGLRDAHAAWKRQAVRARRDARIAEVRLVTRRLWSEGCYPGRERVARAMRPPAALREPWLQDAWRSELESLGFAVNGDSTTRVRVSIHSALPHRVTLLMATADIRDLMRREIDACETCAAGGMMPSHFHASIREDTVVQRPCDSGNRVWDPGGRVPTLGVAGAVEQNGHRVILASLE